MDPPLVPLVPVVVFHARLGRCFSHPGKNGIQILYPSSVQDISQAGNQEGMAGARSSLVKHVFRVFDTLAKGQLRPMGRKFQFQSVLHFFNFLSMAQAFSSNVLSLMQRSMKMREVVHYIVKNWTHYDQPLGS